LFKKQLELLQFISDLIFVIIRKCPKEGNARKIRPEESIDIKL